MPYIQTRDRTSLFYTDAGAGRPMVFVASAWLDSRMWEFQIPYLVDHGFRCIAYRSARARAFRFVMGRLRLRHARR